MKFLFCVSDCKKGAPLSTPRRNSTPKGSAATRGEGVWAQKLGRKGEKLPLVHTFVKQVTSSLQTGLQCPQRISM